MDTEKARLFVTLAENLNFHRSAQIENISASKLSRVIKHLEQDLGVLLFERDNRHVVLTPQGERFLAFAREQLSQWTTFRDVLKKDSHPLQGTVSIYCSVTASYSFLYDILEKARYRYPRIQIKLHTGDTADALSRVEKGMEDIAIAARPDALDQSLRFERFDTSPLMLFQSTDNDEFEQQLRRDTPEHWASIPMIVSERGLSRQRFDQWVSNKGFSPNIFAQVSGNEAIVSMVSLGLGLGFIPKIVVENSPLKANVKPFSVQPPVPAFEVGACVQQRRLKSPIVRALWSLIA